MKLKINYLVLSFNLILLISLCAMLKKSDLLLKEIHKHNQKI